MPIETGCNLSYLINSNECVILSVSIERTVSKETRSAAVSGTAFFKLGDYDSLRFSTNFAHYLDDPSLSKKLTSSLRVLSSLYLKAGIALVHCPLGIRKNVLHSFCQCSRDAQSWHF